MANNIALFKKYIDKLDEVYKYAAKTSVLDGDASLVQDGRNTNEIVIPKMSMDGLGDYSRNDGYVKGAVDIIYQTVTFNYDRGRKFSVDAMDDEETAGIAFGRLSGEFIRVKASPEVDAFRMATYYGLSNISKQTGAPSTGADVLDALIVAQNKMDEDEVTQENRILFILSGLLRKARLVDLTKNTGVLDEFSAIVTIPQNRFYTAIDLLDGSTSGEEAGHYAKATGAKNCNFAIFDKGALLQYPKHKVNKIITPEDNQFDDSWMLFYREYGLVDAYSNKRAGIYFHTQA